MRTDDVHVSVVAAAVVAVGVGEEDGGEVGDEGEGHQSGGTRHPSQLSYGPRQRQNAGAYHRRYDVGAPG